MKRLAIGLAVLLLVLLVVDFVARAFVQGRVESEFRDANRIQAEGVDFSIDSFPFLGRLGLLGEVSATLRLEDVVEQGVTIDEFELEVDGLNFDRDRAFRGEVLVTGLDRARAAVRFEQETVSELFGVAVEFGDGTATAGGVAVQASLAGDQLTLGAQGVGQVTLTVPVQRYVPCDPEVVFREGVVEASCTTTQLPPIVNQVLGR